MGDPRLFYDEDDIKNVSKFSFWYGFVAGLPTGFLVGFFLLWVWAEYLAIK